MCASLFCCLSMIYKKKNIYSLLFFTVSSNQRKTFFALSFIKLFLSVCFLFCCHFHQKNIFLSSLFQISQNIFRWFCADTSVQNINHWMNQFSFFPSNVNYEKTSRYTINLACDNNKHFYNDQIDRIGSEWGPLKISMMFFFSYSKIYAWQHFHNIFFLCSVLHGDRQTNSSYEFCFQFSSQLKNSLSKIWHRKKSHKFFIF